MRNPHRKIAAGLVALGALAIPASIASATTPATPSCTFSSNGVRVVVNPNVHNVVQFTNHSTSNVEVRRSVQRQHGGLGRWFFLSPGQSGGFGVEALTGEPASDGPPILIYGQLTIYNYGAGQTTTITHRVDACLNPAAP